MTIDRRNLSHLNRGSLGIQWLQGLARAGVRRSTGAVAEQLYALAQQLHDIDEEIAQTFVGDQLFFPLPDGWWLWMPLVYSGGFLWALRYNSEAPDSSAYIEERMSLFMMFCIALGVVSAVVLSVKFIRERDARVRKERLRPTLVDARDGLRNELLRLRETMVAHTSEQ